MLTQNQTMNMIKKIGIKLSYVGLKPTKLKWTIVAMHHEKAASQYNYK
jgi:hypothetical protein